MEKKLLYIAKQRVNAEMLEVQLLQEHANGLFKLLQQFGITDPEAIKNPIETVNEKLKESSPTNGIETPISNILKLIGKEREYKTILKLGKTVPVHKYIDLLDFTDNYIRVKPTANLIIKDLLTPYLTDPKEIEFVERIERFIEEASSLSEILGVNLGNTDLLRTFHAHRIDGKVLIAPGDHIKRI